MDNVKRLYSIGEISQMCNIPIRTLRYYDEEDLLRPETRDTGNNYRFYSQRQLLEIIIIKELKSLAFSLDDIKNIMRQKNLDLIKRGLESKVQKIKDDIEELNKQLKTAVNTFDTVINGLNILESIKEDIRKCYKFELMEMPKSQVVYTRYPGQYCVTDLWLERFAELQKIRETYQLHASGPYMAVFHDHYTTQFLNEPCDLELCLPIIEENQHLPFVREFGGFLAAVTTHIGKYPDLFHGYSALSDWIDEHSFNINGPAVEQYIVHPTNTDYEENYVTKIILPVKHK